MVRLELTLTEAQHLHRWLTTPAQPPGAVDTSALGQTVGAKLATAIATATQRRQCPSCQQWFTQEHSGRLGCYCSAACKQKAYRQRTLARRKQFGPTKR